MSNRTGLWLSLALLAAFFALLYAVAEYTVVAGTELALFSSRRYDPYGTSALREYLSAVGRNARLLERPVPPRSMGAALVVFLPAGREYVDGPVLSTQRRKRIREWVEDGNRLVLVGRRLPWDLRGFVPGWEDGDGDGDGWTEIRPMEKDQAKGDYAEALTGSLEAVEVVEADDAATVGMVLYLARPGVGDFAASEDERVLAGIEAGTLASSSSLGAGSVVYLADPTPALNYTMELGDNFEFVLSLLGDGDVWFDEYSLGLGREESMMDWLKRLGLGPFIVQGLVALFVLARSAKSDFANVVEPEEESTPAEEQIAILAGLYDRTLTDHELDWRLWDHGRRG